MPAHSSLVFDASEFSAIATNHFENDTTDHPSFNLFEGDVIMSEASRSLDYGSSAPDLGVTLGFLSPQDLVLPQSQTTIIVGPPKYPLPEAGVTLSGNEKKRRYAHTVLQVLS